MRNVIIIAGIFIALSSGNAQEAVSQAEAAEAAQTVPVTEAASPGAVPDVENMVGLTLREVFAFYGQPDAVHAVRGVEEWQDDVVFVYDERRLDIYIYKDRVWQVSAQSALGVKKGDQKTTALRILSGKVEDKGDHVLYRYPESVWPKYARLSFDALDRISAIYIYRPDM
ncbi:MAG: hypothetical protein LBT00_16215 [Spirochaetaceae bacterium]|nr:hypothetical protein [Spirochaetaceae bacterium]